MASTGPRRKIFYGWIVLAGAMLIYFGTTGPAWYSYGPFLPTMITKFAGYSRSVLSAPYTLYLALIGLAGPLVGITITKLGIRKTIIIGIVLASLGLIGMAFTKYVWQLYLFYGIIIGIGHSFESGLPNTTLVNNWFSRKRALAMGIYLASGGAAGLIFTPLITQLIPSLGWLLSWVCLAGTLLVFTIAGLMLVRDKPEDMGLVPDGEIASIAQETSPRATARKRVYQTPVEWKVGDALRTSALWLIIAFEVISQLTRMLLQVHHVAYIQEIGFSVELAAATLSLQIGISIVGRLVVGFLGTRFEMRHLAAACLAGFIVGMLILMNAHSVPLIYLYTLLVGLSWGGLMVVRPTVMGAYYGRRSYPMITGYIAPLSSVISAVGPLFAGFVYDKTGSYMVAFIISAVLLGIGFVFALLARPPKPPITP